MFRIGGDTITNTDFPLAANDTKHFWQEILDYLILTISSDCKYRLKINPFSENHPQLRRGAPSPTVDWLCFKQDFQPGNVGNKSITIWFGHFVLCCRIESFLNLNASSESSAELYQVANYGLAGQYIHHYDPVGIHNHVAVRFPALLGLELPLQ